MRLRSLALTCALAWNALGSAADAQWDPSGTVSAQVLFEVDTDETRRGGGLMVDVWEPFGVFQLGLAFGISAINSDNDDTSQILTPLGLSVGVGTSGAIVGFRLAVRGGMWGGATKGGLEAGGWMSAGGTLDFALSGPADGAADDGHSVSLGVGLEYWHLWGKFDRDVVVPSLQLVWRR